MLRVDSKRAINHEGMVLSFRLQFLPQVCPGFEESPIFRERPNICSQPNGIRFDLKSGSAERHHRAKYMQPNIFAAMRCKVNRVVA